MGCILSHRGRRTGSKLTDSKVSRVTPVDRSDPVVPVRRTGVTMSIGPEETK